MCQGRGQVEIGEGLALVAVVSLPCTPQTRRSQPALNTLEMLEVSEALSETTRAVLL